MTVTVVGIGLIGGSFALALKDKGLANRVIGVDSQEEHKKKALALRLVDDVKELAEAVKESELIFLAVPVDAASKMLPLILDMVDKQVVMDAGSTKEGIVDAVKDHPKRGRFVATHPMWGTEYSGPDAAVRGAFEGKATVICNEEESDEDAVDEVENIYRQLGM
ncbi:MAG TPA: prephenate dehydrogenase/arogenate dehydrogenase family protein, partial [Flavisolibacter sp.]